MSNVGYSCTCEATMSSRASMTQHSEDCSPLVNTDISGSSSMSSSSASPAKSTVTALPQSAIPLCHSDNLPMHSSRTSSRHRWRKYRPHFRQNLPLGSMITPGFHLYYRQYMETLLTDAMARIEQLQERLKDHEATIKELHYIRS